jgi:hypothetical protein
MERSYLFRNIGEVFAPIFIAFARITKELKSYHPNHKKIQAFFAEYPGMSGSAIQTVMKRLGIRGDAYRLVQNISINADGSYANSEEFRKNFIDVMMELDLPTEAQEELLQLLEPSFLVAPVAKKIKNEISSTLVNLNDYKEAALEVCG